MSLSQLFNNLIILCIILLLGACKHEPQPKTAAPKKTTTQTFITESRPLSPNETFVQAFLPQIDSANNQLSMVRLQIIKARGRYKSFHRLPNAKRQWLDSLAHRYKLKTIQFGHHINRHRLLKNFDTLLYRVDIVPAQMIMAQAAIESQWGRSRFAREGNNYFGIRCYRPNCGIKPLGVDSARWAVKIYPNMYASITDYLYNINVGHAYEQVRALRADARKNHQQPDAFAMVNGLIRYSEKGNEYINLVKKVMRKYLIPIQTKHEITTASKDLHTPS